MTRFINAIVIQCSKGWRFDNHSCLFNTKLLLSLFAWMNISASLILLLGKKRGLDISYYKINCFPFSLSVFLLVMYIFLSILYPKKKIFAIKLEEGERKKYLRNYILYILLTIIYMILAGVLSK
jgi:hypothetical protein